MVLQHPWYKKIICYVFCEWFTKPLFKKRLCVCIYDVLGINKKLERKLKGKDGGLMFLRLPKIITFIGLDGAGKTTQAKLLVDYLKKQGKKVEYIHIIRKRSFTKKLKKIDLKKTKNPLISILRQKLFVARILLFYIKKIKIKLSRTIYVYDRWFYDEFVHLKYLRMCYLPWFYKAIIPKPNITFFIDVKAEKAYKRKPEFNIDYFKEKEIYYKELANKIKATTIADDSIENIKKQVQNIIKLNEPF